MYERRWEHQFVHCNRVTFERSYHVPENHKDEIKICLNYLLSLKPRNNYPEHETRQIQRKEKLFAILLYCIKGYLKYYKREADGRNTRLISEICSPPPNFTKISYSQL